MSEAEKSINKGEKSTGGGMLIVAPRRLADVEVPAIFERYFPGLELELDPTKVDFMAEVLEDESFERLEPESYGVVMLVEGLEHIRRPEMLAGAVLDALEPGGVVLASVPFALPLHEVERDYRRFAPVGLAALLEDTGFSDVEVNDSGEEEHWDLVSDSPGLVKVWMPYPRVCYATARKPSGTAAGRTGDDSAMFLDVVYGQEYLDLMAKIDEQLPTLRFMEEQMKKKDVEMLAVGAHSEKVAEDNAAKQEELDRLSAWAAGLEQEIIAMRATAGAPQPAAESPVEPAPGAYRKVRRLGGRVLRKLGLRK